jgi:2-dehydro-3-deoxyphosphogluconate aldolase/(4S)-4-hydroxy-2-oxoglutarate aldolase
MARFERLDVYDRLLDVGLVPLFYEPNPERAFQAARACATGGAAVIEFTNRGEMAYPVFAELVARLRREAPDTILGVGTVVDAQTAALFLASGANFVVSPTFDEATARLCNRHKVAYIPGCGTATEIGRAEEFGAEIVKLFPAQLFGPAALKALLGVSPLSRVMPTGGVEPTAESIGSWINAGAACVGLGSNLVGGKDLANGDWGAIETHTKSAIKLVAASRAAR